MLSNFAIAYHNELISDKEKIQYIMNRRGITRDTINNFNIGYDKRTRRYTIPIKDILGNIVNIRKWRDQNPKMISQGKGFGEIRLFPFSNLHDGDNLIEEGDIIICEGEWDCILLNQYGFNAVTYTGGASSWKSEWNTIFKNLGITIIFDCDDIGKKSALKVKDNLMPLTKYVRIVDLKLEDKEDISDWFLKYKKTKEDTIALIEQTAEYGEYEHIDLTNSMDSRFYNRNISFYGITFGKDLSPYIIPRIIRAECRTGSKEKKICKMCPLSSTIITKEFKYDNDKDVLVRMINANDMQIKGVLRQAINVPAGRNCPGSYEIEILERQNVEEVLIVPEINYERVNQEYTVRKCFYFGLNLQTNQSHLYKGTTWTNPNTQMGIHLIKEAVPSKDNVTKFHLTEEMKTKLKVFQPKDQDSEQAINEKLEDIYNDFTYNVTRMYERKNIIMAVDLVYHSVLNFTFLKQFVKKGWLECLIIGDTKCGKSETAEQMIHHYRLGEFVTSGENTSFAGLVGGLQQTNRGSWHVTWGKLVMNNKGLAILDEADELAKNGTIALLTGIRSSGIAELVKIQSQRAMAKTRLVFISNPLYGKMSEQNFGVEAIAQIFKTQQDISRIDFAVGAMEEDVSDEIINKVHNEKYEHKYTTELCNLSVMFAWSRKPEHIVFEKKTEKLILEIATSMGREFSSIIPLVISAEMRIKIARISVALAARLYSTDSTGEKIIVKPCHVMVAVNFLYQQYCSNALGYKEYSDQKLRENSIGDTEDIEHYFEDKEVINLLLDQSRFQLSDFEDIFELERSAVKEIVGKMRKNRMIKKKYSYYHKTPAFIEFLKKQKTNFYEVDRLEDIKKFAGKKNTENWQNEI